MRAKPTVWYHAINDHILVRVGRDRIELGCQGSNTIKFDGKEISVPDWLNLFTWKVDLKVWKRLRKNGWLIKIGDL